MVHICHAKNCNTSIAPHLLMCFSCWELVPSYLQELISQTHIHNQEIYKNPSRAWMKYARQALEIVEEKKTNVRN